MDVRLEAGTAERVGHALQTGAEHVTGAVDSTISVDAGEATEHIEKAISVLSDHSHELARVIRGVAVQTEYATTLVTATDASQSMEYYALGEALP